MKTMTSRFLSPFRLPDVSPGEVGPFHLVVTPFAGDIRDHRAIRQVNTALYHQLLDTHRIIGFDEATVYLTTGAEPTGRGYTGFWLRPSPQGVAGANAVLQEHLGGDAPRLEDAFQRQWDTLTADPAFRTLVIPRQPVVQAVERYRRRPRWRPPHRIIPHLFAHGGVKRLGSASQSEVAYQPAASAVIAAADTIRREVVYAVVIIP